MKHSVSREAGRPLAAMTLWLLMLAAHAAFAAAPVTSPSALPIAGVTAPSSAPAEDIRDIRGPKPVASGWLMTLIVATGLLAVCGSYAAWKWNKRRQLAATKLPFEIALDRLDLARELMLPERGRDFSIEVSSCIRGYIEDRFQVRAAHRTTHEFLHDLLESGDSLLAANRTLLGDFLQSCDLAKFGGWNLSTENMEMMLQSARRFVVESAQPLKPDKLKPEPQPAGVREIYDSLPTT